MTGKARSANWLDREAEPVDCAKLVELGAVASLPLRDIAREVQKPSQNLYTDLLLAHVGETTRAADTSARNTSEELGVRALEPLSGPRSASSGARRSLRKARACRATT